MKSPEIVKNSVGAARDLLGGVPHVTIESVECEPNPDYRCDAVIGFTHKSKALALVVEVKANGAPRFVRSAVLQLESGMARLKRSGKADAKPRLIPMIEPLPFTGISLHMQRSRYRLSRFLRKREARF